MKRRVRRPAVAGRLMPPYLPVMRNRVLPGLALLLAGCVEEATIPSVPDQILPTTMSATDRELDAGESATLTVKVANPLDQVVRLGFPTSCQALIVVRNAAGRITTPPNGQFQCASVPSELVIQPGDTARFNVDWAGGVQFGPAGTSERVPPGNYFASAELRADGYTAIAFPILIVVN